MNYQKKNHYNTYKATVKPPPKYRFDKLLVMVAAVFLLAPYLYFQLYGYIEDGAAFAAPCFTAAALCLGYAAQIAFSRLLKFGKVQMDGSYENSEQMFAPSRAFGPFILAAVVMIVIFIASKSYLIWRVDTGIDRFYDRNALFPFIFAPTCALFVALGAIAWFYPAKWLVSIRMLIPAVASIVVCFAFTYFIYAVSLTFFGVNMFIAVSCIIISYLLTRYYASFMKAK